MESFVAVRPKDYEVGDSHFIPKSVGKKILKNATSTAYEFAKRKGWKFKRRKGMKCSVSDRVGVYGFWITRIS